MFNTDIDDLFKYVDELISELHNNHDKIKELELKIDNISSRQDDLIKDIQAIYTELDALDNNWMTYYGIYEIMNYRINYNRKNGVDHDRKWE